MNQLINKPVLEKVVQVNDGVPVIFLPPWLKHLKGAVVSENNNQVFATGSCMTDDQRSKVKMWCREISSYLIPANEDDCGVVISKLLMGFPAAYPGDDELIVKMEIYLAVVGEFPLWAVRYAANQWLRGIGITGKKNFAFPPSPAQFAIACRSKVSGFAAEYSALLGLLEVENRVTISPDERQRMAKRMAQLSDYQKYLAKKRELYLDKNKGSDFGDLEFPSFEDYCKEQTND